ncbi:hypothetical protein [Bradyrhizobium hereditatis]|nr:hypothetical protein [Bradyrhizobium hereditatis]
MRQKQPVLPEPLERTATVIASGIGGFPAIVEVVRSGFKDK